MLSKRIERTRFKEGGGLNFHIDLYKSFARFLLNKLFFLY